MIKSLRLVNFKNFADETLHLGPFTLIVGANASGKSNIRDALRFLHGVGRGFSLPEIMGGKYGEGGFRQWTGIRGAPNEIIRFGQSSLSLELEMGVADLSKFGVKGIHYFLGLERDERASGRFQVGTESLTATPTAAASSRWERLYKSEVPLGSNEGEGERYFELPFYLRGGAEALEGPSNHPRLSQLPKQLYEALGLASQAEVDGEELTDDYLASALAYMSRQQMLIHLLRLRLLELSPERLREPSLPGIIEVGGSGDNLPTVLEAICASPQRKAVLLSWLHELTPMDVSDLEFPVDLNGRVNLRIVEANGQSISAYSASDGTLRFLGMLAALLNEDFEGLYFIEEIDNGIHPSRLHLLLELIERQTAKGKIQVVATTHSPDVLNLINDTTFENAVVVYRDEDAADAVIRRVAELPNAGELRQSQGLGRLHASGWMENVLSFAAADSEDEEGGK